MRRFYVYNFMSTLVRQTALQSYVHCITVMHTGLAYSIPWLECVFTLNKCKKHSLSHQLTAQLHIENSKN